MYKFSNNSKNNMKGVDQRLIDVFEYAIKITNVDFGIPKTGGLRTEKQQHDLFLQGVSKLDGRYRKSKHQFGLALDYFAYVDGAVSYNELHMTQVAIAILQSANILSVKLAWGGLWTGFKDMPHFEIVNKSETHDI